MMLFVPPSQPPTTFPSLSFPLSTTSSEYPTTPFASSFFEISAFRSSQDFLAVPVVSAVCAKPHVPTKSRAAPTIHVFMMEPRFRAKYKQRRSRKMYYEGNPAGLAVTISASLYRSSTLRPRRSFLSIPREMQRRRPRGELQLLRP